MRRLVFGEDARVGPWVCERTGGLWSPVDSATIGMERDGELIAGVLFDHFNGKSIAMHVAAEGFGWMTREYLRAAFRYPFRQLGVAKIIGLVDEANQSARRLDEHLGFRLEASIADGAPGGSLLLYTMTPDQCRYLEH